MSGVFIELDNRLWDLLVDEFHLFSMRNFGFLEVWEYHLVEECHDNVEDFKELPVWFVEQIIKVVEEYFDWVAVIV